MNVKNFEYDLVKDKVLFFDFDGALADTEFYHREALTEAFWPYDINLSPLDWKPYLDYPDRQIIQMLSERFGINIPEEETVSNKLSLFKDKLVTSDVKPSPDMVKLLHVLPNVKYVLTAQNTDFVRFFLEKWNISNIFADIFCLGELDITRKSELIKESGFDLSASFLFDDSIQAVDNSLKFGLACCLVVSRFNAFDSAYRLHKKRSFKASVLDLATVYCYCGRDGCLMRYNTYRDVYEGYNWKERIWEDYDEAYDASAGLYDGFVETITEQEAEEIIRKHNNSKASVN